MYEAFRKYQLNIPNADESLAKHCKQKGEMIYGSPLPSDIDKRMEKELKTIATNNHSTDYLIGKMVVEKSLADGFPVSSRGLIGSSFVSFLCGITAVNPLPPHYYCPDCHLFTFADIDWTDHHLLGYDLPSKTCPNCGKALKTDGAGIRPEILMGSDLTRDPFISINLAEEIHPKIIECIKNSFGKENVIRAGVITPLADGGIRRGVHPGGLFILPKGTNILDLTPLLPPCSDDTSGLWVTEKDYRNLYSIIKMFSLFSYSSVSFLHKLEQSTGTCSNNISLKDKEIFQIFLKHGFSFVSENNRDWPNDDINRELLSKEPSFSNLCKVVALMHGRRTWEHNGEILAEQGKHLYELIIYRDDIMDYLLSKGIPSHECFEIMDCVRRGITLTSKMKYDMRSVGVPEWYIDSCSKIEFIYPKSHIIERMLFYWKLAFYRAYYPFAYKYAMKDFD
ncbi:MAG: hypothetical protein IJH64_05160 [Oscillospiraceae bacterium]|nr:hypothetical protein [Oscillospiraceae bacterium]